MEIYDTLPAIAAVVAVTAAIGSIIYFRQEAKQIREDREALRKIIRRAQEAQRSAEEDQP